PCETAHVLDHVVLVLAEDRPMLVRSGAAEEGAGFQPTPEVLDLVAVQRFASEAELEAVVVGRIVAAGDLDAAVEVPMEDREVDEGCGHDAELDDPEPGRAETVDQGGRICIRGEPAVASDAHAPRVALEGQRAEGPAERAGELRVEIPLGDATDVVFAKDRRVQFSTSTWCRSRRLFTTQSRNRSSSA